MTRTIEPTASGQLLTVRDVSALLKLHVATVWRMVGMAESGHGDFPRPLRLGPKTVRWRNGDILTYIDRLAENGR